MKTIWIVVAILCMAVSGTSALGYTWDLYSEFSGTINTAGATWQYGYGSGSFSPTSAL